MKKRTKFCIHQQVKVPEQVEQFLQELISVPPTDTAALEKHKRAFSAREKCDPILNRDLISVARAQQISLPPKLAALLQKRAVRTISGVTPIGILTKPFPCPGRCVYCPTEVRMPKSYLSSQPAAARALRNKFHPFRQVANRITAVEESGHPVSKLEVIVMGGTWSAHTPRYQSWYVKNIFDAANSSEKSPKPPLKKGAFSSFYGERPLPYNPKLKERAREGRNNPTPAEKELWFGVFQKKQFQKLRFLRQKPIDNFIIDFYCPELMLAIEVDGDSHGFQEAYDQKRTEILEGYGILLLRYTNNEVLSNLEGVYADLEKKIQQRKKELPFSRGDVLQSRTEGFFVRSKTLAESQKQNETADRRVIGLTLETRPDWITEEELIRMRRYGCTRIEIGVQTLDDDIQKLTKRGHKRVHVARAMKLMRDFGFKICWHLMPGLPGSTLEKDLEMMQEVWTNPDFRPDFIKIYPCQVLPNSELAHWWKDGKFIPLSDEALMELLLKWKKTVPEYARIMRLMRDIPVGDVLAGVRFSNLRQILKTQPHKIQQLLGPQKFQELFPRGHVWPCRCVRCREVGFQDLALSSRAEKPVLVRREYDASGGTEVFLSCESPDKKVLYALLRLRKPSSDFHPKEFSSVLKDAALVREVHSYGAEISVGDAAGVGQHRGLGRQLLAEAERIAREEWGLGRMTIIAGVGTRDYYRKFGYQLRSTYMTKKLK